MSVITIVGSGMMGSAMSFPAMDNGHEVRLVGTHIDREIIDSIKGSGYHPTLKRQLPQGIKAFQIEEIEKAIEDSDLIIGGVSSFGVDWFTENILPLIPEEVPLLSVTKGLQDFPQGELLTFPHIMKESLPQGRELSLNAIGGPCTSYELADRRHSSVVFCGDDPKILKRLKDTLETSYYHIGLSTDVIGLETAVALKNAYALGVTLSVGLLEKKEGVGSTQAYNPQAALFGQSVYEMSKIIDMVGGDPNNIVYGAGDLYVTIFGGRTRKLGTLLGRGLSFKEAMEELKGITLESVVITERIVNAMKRREELGQIDMADFPLLNHIHEIIIEGKPVDIPWASFGREYL